MNNIIRGLETIDKLEEKLVQGILKETPSFLRDMVEMLIKNIRKKMMATAIIKNKLKW